MSTQLLKAMLIDLTVEVTRQQINDNLICDEICSEMITSEIYRISKNVVFIEQKATTFYDNTLHDLA